MTIDVPQTPQTLQSIMQKSNPYGEILFLQAHLDNTENVFFGPIGECELFLAPGLSASYPATSLASIQVCTTAAAQKLVVVFNQS